MTKLNDNYRITPDQYGLVIIEVTGRCTHDEVATIEANCCRDYKMVPIPNASGAVLKSLDGTQPRVVSVTPTTFGSKSYDCVKVEGRCNPLAPVQDAGDYSGSAIVTFFEKYQQVGSAV